MSLPPPPQPSLVTPLSGVLPLHRSVEEILLPWLLHLGTQDGTLWGALVLTRDADGVEKERPLLAGHASTDLPEPGYLVVAVSGAGGAYASAGCSLLTVRAQVKDHAHASGLAAHDATVRALAEILDQRNAYEIVAELNELSAARAGRVLFSGFELADNSLAEARDEKNRHHYSMFEFRLLASLKADAEE